MADILLQLLLLLSPFWGPFVLLWTVQATTRMRRHYGLFAIVVPVFLVLDQVTKYWARSAMKLRERIDRGTRLIGTGPTAPRPASIGTGPATTRSPESASRRARSPETPGRNRAVTSPSSPARKARVP